MAAANNVFDFEKFKKQQEDTIREFKEQQLSAKSENKNVKITAKKIREKYRKMRKKQIISKSQKEETFESFLLPLKKSKRQVDKAAQIAAKKISKKNTKTSDLDKMMDGKKIDYKFAKDAFNMLKVDPSSIVFTEEILDKKLFLKLKKLRYAVDRQFFKVVNLLKNFKNVIFEPENVNRTDYVEKF